jgi:hypothetical protein
MKLLRKIGSHGAIAVASALFAGGIGVAGAATGGADGSTDNPVPPVMTVWEDPYADTVCAQPPTAAPAARYSVYQDTTYGFVGNNDRIRVGTKFQSWSNDAFDPNVSPYEDFVRLEARGHNSTRLTSVWTCKVNTRQIQTDEIDPYTGYPKYEMVVDSAEWVEITNWSNRVRKVDVPRPQIVNSFTETGEYVMTGHVALYVTATGRGPSQVTTIGGCCPPGGGVGK